MPKKNLLFIDQYSNMSGGQNVLFNIIGHLFKKGYNCTVILPEKGEFSARLNGLGIKTLFLPMGYYAITNKKPFDFILYILRFPILIMLLLYTLKSKKPDLVYINGARAIPWATLVCFIKKIPAIWHLHSIFDKGMTKNTILYFANYGIVKKIICVSEIVKAPFQKFSSKIQVIYNAVNIPSLPKTPNLLKKEYNLKDNSFLVGSIGIIERWKNQEDMVEAAKKILGLEPTNIYFFIIGDYFYSPDYKTKIVNMIKNYSLGSRVFLTGFRKDILPVMNALDAVVITSRDADPCPMVSLEAASLGLGIISIDTGGVKEIFKSEHEAMFYKAGDIENLAYKILGSYKNKANLNSMGQNAKNKVIKDHGIENYLNKITELIEKASA